MKTLVIIFGVLFLLFLGSQIYLYKSSHDIEGYKYVVIKSYADFEIRQYEASLFTSVKLDTDDYKQASSNGFSILVSAARDMTQRDIQHVCAAR